MIRKLLYASTAVQDFTDHELMDILDRSRVNNARDRITGLLLYDARTFIQLLEGPSEAVERTHERIERDPRHTSLVTLIDAEYETRTFPEWQMGFLPRRNFTAKQALGFSRFMENPRRLAHGDAALELLESFCENVRA